MTTLTMQWTVMRPAWSTRTDRPQQHSSLISSVQGWWGVLWVVWAWLRRQLQAIHMIRQQQQHEQGCVFLLPLLQQSCWQVSRRQM